MFGPILVSVAIWVVSYSGIVYAPQTKRHLIMLAGGVVMLRWQERSMPTDLPVEDSRDYRSWAAPMGAGNRKIAPPIDSNGVWVSSTRCRAARFEPGMRYMGIEITQMTWIPKYRFNGRVDTHVVIVPTYLPSVCIVIAAAAIWLRDRRTVKPGP